mmetsp:Transcript_12639/g.34848  ORF Transcript_12639/g.34848 Transcript_12639/m.34848 type:complete len:103 (-) Transcript_12639:2020-2328(-)
MAAAFAFFRFSQLRTSRHKFHEEHSCRKSNLDGGWVVVVMTEAWRWRETKSTILYLYSTFNIHLFALNDSRSPSNYTQTTFSSRSSMEMPRTLSRRSGLTSK